MACLVIGSGPAGVSCAKALLAQGRRVVMIDAGLELEPERALALNEMSERAPETWAGAGSAWMREGVQATADGIPLKLAYGSDYPYRGTTGAPVVAGDGVNTRFSLAKGGLSQVWGAAVMPYRQGDMAGWPVTAEELAPHYRAVLEFMPVAQQKDGLEEAFPTFRATEAMPLSPQAGALMARMQANEAALRVKGVTFGRSRLAVNVKGVGAKDGCVRCGLCLYGCPYGLIYSAAETVEAMRREERFSYMPGYVVERVEESANGVRVHMANARGETEVMDGDRAFLAAGALSTAVVMLRSLDPYGVGAGHGRADERVLEFKESQYFLLPMLRLEGVPGFRRGDVHTLAQMFVEVMDETLSAHTIHLQAYTYNDLFEGAIRQRLGVLARLFPWETVLQRLYLMQGYLLSEDSPVMEGRLERGVLQMKAKERPETGRILDGVVRKLAALRRETGLVPLGRLMRRAEPGRGFHVGGSFPMVGGAPQKFESDTLGRVGGMKRVHVVDASVLPSIAATTITFTVMANAHRIGTMAGKEG